VQGEISPVVIGCESDEDDVEYVEDGEDEEVVDVREEESMDCDVVSVSECASEGCGVGVGVIEVNEGANEVREVPGVSDVVWKCPVCQQQWQEGDPDGSWLGCDYCHRCWHTACMPVKMRKEAQDSIANDKENEKWHCWVCASALNFLCGASEVYCCKKDINVKVFCMRCKRKELLSKVLSHEWLVCARDECQLRVHRRCVSGSNASWVCGIC